MNGLRLPKEDYFKLLGQIADYYKSEEQNIIELAKDKPHLWHDINWFHWPRIFTPIEYQAWEIFRSRSHCVFYPQYPACSFHIDFANPFYKTGIELDGKEYHNLSKDSVRDRVLAHAGWKIFRITGQEMGCRLYNINSICDFKNLNKNEEKLYREWLENTGEGVIESIRQFYFLPDNKRRFHLMHLYVSSLRKHRLIEFELTNSPVS